ATEGEGSKQSRTKKPKKSIVHSKPSKSSTSKRPPWR
ncbi:hypothetical protein A2U01_0111163, partial [Trifolium medium]|nr:hypothetical protein [Trifolium medium]